MKPKLKLIALLLLGATIAVADSLPVPRFSSIKSDKVNARTGPSARYPIEWVFVSKNEPVEILAEFELWRKVRDKYGDGGWIHSSMLSSKRYAVIIGNTPQSLHNEPDSSSKIIAKLAPELRCKVKRCVRKWCKITCKDQQGWVEKSHLWGIYSQEEF